MDQCRFDSLARTLGAAGTRRRALAALFTGLVVPLLSSLEATADRGKGKRRKGRGKGRDQGHGRDNGRGKSRGKGGGVDRGHDRGKSKDRENQPDKPAPTPVDATAKACRGEGHPCEGNQRCCAGLVCVTSGPGAATRCTPCPDGQIACANACIPACTVSDPCHVTGECDPQTGACTNPNAEDGAPCDDDDLCTVEDSCRDGECRGRPKACSALSDACHDGVCRPADGECVPEPKPDGTSCNADNTDCTMGDSCQNGVCTPGAGIDCSAESDVCNDGVCRPSDGKCIRQQMEDGTPCGPGQACVGGKCQRTCLALRAVCDPSDNQCCDADCAETLPNCNQPGNRCCLGTRKTCGADCECCGLSFCEDSKCCSHTGNRCESEADCCQNVLNRQACVAGNCCALDGEPCEGPNDCCEGLCDPEGFCTGCLSLQQNCDPKNNQCCQSGGTTNCGFSFDFNETNCCRPPGGTCQETRDCCDGRTCNNGRCCVGEHFHCSATSDCCSGFECRSGFCRTTICLEPGEACHPAQDTCCHQGGAACQGSEPFAQCCLPLRSACEQIPGVGDPCCSFECDDVHGICCVPDFAILGARTCNANEDCCSGFCHLPTGNCCRTEGAQCSQPGPGPFSECCPYLGLTCNGDGFCARCRKTGETCDVNPENPTVSTCCIGRRCENGHCVQSGCNLAGPFCQEDEICCPGSRCNADAGVCFQVCSSEGRSCVGPGSLPCCGGLTCNGGGLDAVCVRS